MSQALISASEKSVTLSKMVSMNKTVPFYQPTPAMDAGGILFTKVTPSIGINNGNPIADQTITWTLPSAGFMIDASFGFKCRLATVGDAATTHLIGFNMIRQFQVISNGVPVITKTGVGLKMMTSTLRDAGAQTFIRRHATFLNAVNEIPQVPADGTTDWLTYLPCIETFLTETEKVHLLNKEKLEFAVTFSSNAAAGVLGNITFSAAPILYLKTFMPKLSLYNEMVTQDWSKQFTMNMINNYVEPVPLTTNTTVTGYQITCPYPATKTHFVVQRVVTTGLSNDATPVEVGAAVGGAPTLKINQITMNIGGLKFLDEYKTSRVISNECKHGMSKFGLAAVGTGGVQAVQYSDDILTIDWGLTGSRSSVSGINFWAENQGSTVDLVFESAGGAFANQANKAHYQLFIVHEFIQLVDWVPGSGGRGFLQVTSNN